MQGITSAATFAQDTWGAVQLGDQRLNRRAVSMGTAMAANPAASLPGQMRDPAALEGAYRLLNNRFVSLPTLLAPSYQVTRERAGQQAVVLLVNDQTELDYTVQMAKTGLGPVGNEHGKGLLMHSTLAVAPETRAVLGLSYVQLYLRQLAPKPRPKWVQTPEGLCWENATRAIGAPPAGSVWVSVSDAGSDYFAYLAACLDTGKQFLVRISRERMLEWTADDPQAEQLEAQKLIGYARTLPPAPGSASAVDVSAHKHQPARTAQVILAWAPVTLGPSAQAVPQARQHPAFPAWVLRVWEPDPPQGVEALEWILLSSLPVTNLREARCRVDWYTCRWLCEDFHQCLKTGCQVEHSQLSDRADLENLIGFAAPIAVRLLQLRQAARQNAEGPAEAEVDPLMLTVLALHLHLQSEMMTLATFWRLVARLGGFQGRKRDGDPGWRTVWRGWQFLSGLTAGARLLAQSRTKL